MCIKTFFIKLSSEYIGQDKFGNKYYSSKCKDYLGRNKRFVIYQGLVEPSKVPPLWHAWLHYLSDETPIQIQYEQYKWQKSHLPNLTGTDKAYKPTKGKLSSEYQPWQPQ